jgi:hypothetical protein
VEGSSSGADGSRSELAAGHDGRRGSWTLEMSEGEGRYSRTLLKAIGEGKEEWRAGSGGRRLGQ